MIHKADRDENNYSVLANDKTLILWLADLFGKIKVPFLHLPVYIFLFPSGWVVNHTHLVVLSLHWLGNFLSPISFFYFFFFAVFGLDKASDKVQLHAADVVQVSVVKISLLRIPSPIIV